MTPHPEAVEERRAEIAERLIWWLSQQDVERLYSYREAGRCAEWPTYLLKEFISRDGRNGRGRLWVAKQFGNVDVTAAFDAGGPACEMAEICGGIVIAAEDHRHVAHLPGFVTTLDMQFTVELSRLTAALTAREGYVLVPVADLTNVAAGIERHTQREYVSKVASDRMSEWSQQLRAMIAARPTPASGEGK